MAISQLVFIVCDHNKCKSNIKKLNMSKTELIKLARSENWLVKDSLEEFYCPLHRNAYDGRRISSKAPQAYYISGDNVLESGLDDVEEYFSKH